MSAPAMVAGTGLEIAGGVKSDIDQANAENNNIEFFGEQAQFAEMAGERAEYLINQSEEELIGAQLSSFAKAGVQTKGSALTQLGETARRAESERQAARKESQMNVRLAKLRQQASKDRQAQLLDPMNWILRGAGQAAAGGGQLAQAGAFDKGGMMGNSGRGGVDPKTGAPIPNQGFGWS